MTHHIIKIITAGFDPQNQYIGIKTPLDNVNLQRDNGSLTPMDPNWVGGKCTQKAINAGEFDGRRREPNSTQGYN